MGFAGYFLITQDLKYAKDSRIPVGPGGSAVGSIVSYCLGILMSIHEI